MRENEGKDLKPGVRAQYISFGKAQIFIFRNFEIRKKTKHLVLWAFSLKYPDCFVFMEYPDNLDIFDLEMVGRKTRTIHILIIADQALCDRKRFLCEKA